MSGFYVLDVPEFKPLIDAVRKNRACSVHEIFAGYRLIEFNVEIEIERTETGLQSAVWFGCLTGGLDGKITTFDSETLRIAPTNEPPLGAANGADLTPTDQ